MLLCQGRLGRLTCGGFRAAIDATSRMNIKTDAGHAGVAGVKMDVAEFELGHGLILRRAYAFLMAPFVMAFAPAEPGKAHPPPWAPVNSAGFAQDIYIELLIPQSFTDARFLDRPYTAWWITSLIRLRGAAGAAVPILADRALNHIPANWNGAVILPIEVTPRFLVANPAIENLSLNDLQWLRDTWHAGIGLMANAVFRDAYEAFDAARWLPNPGVSLLAMWGALELLFSPSTQELRFRVSANIAAYLEPQGMARLNLHRRVLKLYDARSGVAHGGKLKSSSSWQDTHELANRILLKMLSLGHVPTKDELENDLFGGGS